MLIAFLFLPAYLYLGETFKLAVFPYLFFLVWKGRLHFIPALFVHTIAGSTVSIFILLVCFFKIITSQNSFTKPIKRVLFISLIPSPLIFYLFFDKLFFQQYSFIESFTSLGFYLGVFPFFYGYLLAKEYNSKIWYSTLNILTIIYFTSLVFELKFRINSFTQIFFITIAILFFFRRKILPLSYNHVFYAFTIFISSFIGIIEYKFHSLFSSLFAFFLLLFSLKQTALVNFKSLVKPRIFLLSTLIIILVASNSFKYGSTVEEASTSAYYSLEKLPETIQYKAFGDRGVIWYGAWQHIVNNVTLMPPYEPSEFDYVNANGQEITDISYGAHNIVLELIRQYGIITGVIVSFSFILQLLFLGKSLLIPSGDRIMTIFGCVIFSTGLIAGATGQFVLMINFSFLFLASAGIISGRSKRIE